MTSLAVALAVDSRGPAALYIITDSRLTWGAANQRWDAGQKTFASTWSADIFGFCGDAFFPPAVLRQLLDQVNTGVLFANSMTAERRHALLAVALQRSVEQQMRAPMRSFSVFHGARDGEFMQSRFRLWETGYCVVTRTWSDEETDLIAARSYLAHIDGTGAGYIRKRSHEWVHTDAEGTSRAAMWAFCNALHEGQDQYSGGAPQLVGIWRKGPARTFGLWWRGKAYMSGLEVPSGSDVTQVSWFNHRFERCDGSTGRRLKDAQRHTKPKPIE